MPSPGITWIRTCQSLRSIHRKDEQVLLPRVIQIMGGQFRWLRLSILAALSMAALNLPCRTEEPIPKLNYEAVPDSFQLPPGEHFVEVAGVAVNSKGHIYVFHRGKHPLMEFDSSGKFARSIADDLFATAHTVRVDAEDNRSEERRVGKECRCGWWA